MSYEYYVAKIIIRCFILTVIALSTFNLKGQDVSIVEDKSMNRQVGDCLLKHIQTNHDGKKGHRVFEIEAPTDGAYYVSTIISAYLEAGRLKPLKLLLDGKLVDNMGLTTSKSGFQNLSLIDVNKQTVGAIWLSKGDHKLSFEAEGMSIPLIDAIRLSRQLVNAQLENVDNLYIDKLKSNKLSADYDQIKKRDKGARILANPEGNYYHELDIPLEYTFFYSVYLQQGESVTFETRNSNTDPVLYVFNSGVNLTETYSNDDTNGRESTVSFTAGNSTTYRLYVRTYSPGTSGVADIYKNGSLLATAVPVAGTYKYFYSKNALVNVFTTYSPSIDTQLFIPTTGTTGPIKYYNDDFGTNGGGNWNWTVHSRIKQNFNGANVSALISTYSISDAGNCDFYANCEFSNAPSYFPNLNSDDAIQSAPQSSNYNCGSWAGGITSFWWFPNSFSDWYVANNYLQSFDNFYGNNPARYSGAYTYTRSGADASNGMVALWYNQYSGYTHVSVRKPANDNPHGYDWESKPGSLMRTMHPRDALQDNGSSGYGSISNYYRYTGVNARLSASSKPITLEESINAGLSKLDPEDFSDSDYQLLNRLRENLTASDVSQFNEHFDAWHQTWLDLNLQIASNPRAYTISKEYTKLLSFLKEKGTKLIPLVIDCFKKNDMPLSALIEDGLLPGNGALLETIKIENRQKLYDENLVYIVRSNTVNCIKFLRKLLIQQTQITELNSVVVAQNYPNTFTDATTFKFFLPEKGKVTIELYSSKTGQFISKIVDETNFERGWQYFHWRNHPSALESGTYIYRIIVNGKLSDTKRLMVN